MFTARRRLRVVVNIVKVETIALKAVEGLSSEDFLHCQLPIGFPFLVDRDSQEIIEPVFRFVWTRHVKDGNFRRNTANAEVSDLKDWYVYLAMFEKVWSDVCRADIEDYRDLMSKLVSPKTHEHYSLKTVSRRVSTIQEFYRHFNLSGETDVDVGDRAIEVKARPHDQDALTHIRGGGSRKSSEVLPVQENAPDDEVRAMSSRQYQLIANVLGPTPGLDPEDRRPVRDRLWAELCIHTGLRPGEPERLTIYDILDLSPQNPTNPLGITYLGIRGKGGKFRKVELPNQVLVWLHGYIENEREEAIAEGVRRGHISARSKPSSLFLNHTSAGQHAGNPMRYQTFHDVFANAVKTAASSGGQSAGLLRTVIKTDPDTTEKYTVREPNFSPHCLRHTFAVWYYLGERAAGNAEPWKKLQVLLGHAHLETTTNTYLRVAGEFEAMVSDRVTEHLAGLLRLAR
ncbi:tyrosine-type recombinase/integrase [Paucibacter sp. KCTC 42545]|uniref:tyrosine-type recombinase/integrase n=1 Tax=Paucibacter sp. KCTC 42545 TaxID=1768242 RepID=UPI000733BB81|nr:tyrosine-type recombinase/integrase [Paucibacter sp. KCTC 42545]ALT79045.1 hypothetical protein AT984_19490 [Paucibacter sp. KCTC 42545]